jgi:hypothetical protein
VTVAVGGRTRTFVDGDGVTFAKRQGANRRFTVDRVEFVAYGVDAPRAHHVDIGRKDVRSAAVVWLGDKGPKGLDGATYRTVLAGRRRYAVDQRHAAVGIGPEAPPVDTAASEAAQGFFTTEEPVAEPLRADFTTTERLDVPRAPTLAGSDAFFEFLFSAAPVRYDELRRRAEAQEPLPSFRLDGVTLTFNLDNDYQVVRTRLAQNVAAVVEGADPQERGTYVAFGAHYDHVGYAEGARPPLFALSRPGGDADRIWNGADDDGSGTAALMALAKAFAEGPRPKRSLLFVWHTGEERGRYGSLFFADYPTVPLSSIAAQLNVDMIGRNRGDNPKESGTVYLVGSDRISSELHAVSRQANDALPAPMTLSYELNDPGDPEQLYFRSDHYSYAAKGIPVIFFTTGLHPDYHMNTDEVSRIEFDKMTRVTQLIYETGWRLANLDHFPVRDNKGARAK